MNKVYDYEEANKVIVEAWNLAIEHLENILGDQYDCNVTENAMVKFWDCVQQDIEHKKVCPRCSQVDLEGNFCSIQKEYGSDRTIEVCYSCYKDNRNDAE